MKLVIMSSGSFCFLFVSPFLCVVFFSCYCSNSILLSSCRLRSKRLNQRNPQTQHLVLYMVVNLGGVLMVMLLGGMVTLSAVMVLIGLAHLRIGHMVGCLIGMENLVDMVVDLVGGMGTWVGDTETWVEDMGTMVVIVESLHLGTLVAMGPLVEVLVVDTVKVH